MLLPSGQIDRKNPSLISLMSRNCAIVILNWNTSRLLSQFLPPLLRSEGYGVDGSVPQGAATPPNEVIVADSGSTDDSLSVMAQSFPHVRTIPLGENYGFTGGYNRALGKLSEEGEFKYFLLLNSDIEVTGGWTLPLTEWMDSHPGCGACCPTLHSYYDKDSFEYAGAAGGLLDSLGYPFCRGRVLSTLEKDCGQYGDGPHPVFWATGASLMVRSSLWKELGGLDDRFFAHMEEIDFCWRLQLEGYSVYTVPGSVVYHLGGATLPSTSPKKTELNFRNNLLLLGNNLAKTFALRRLQKKRDSGRKEPFTHEEALLLAGKCVRKASRRITMRMLLDGGSALVYLLGGKASLFSAVISAHTQYRKLSSTPREEEIAQVASYIESTELLPTLPTVRGMYRGWMIPYAVLFRKAFQRRVCRRL